MQGIYEFSSEGVDSIEERNIKFNEDGLLFGFGPMDLDEQGVFRYRSQEDIEYDYLLTLVSCNRYDAWYQELFSLDGNSV
jgi:hypothetical protein